MPLPFFRRPLPSLLPPRTFLFSFLTWLPAFIFFFDNAYQPMTVTGPSMYPFLNTDYDSTTRKDTIWVKMWNPAEGLRRGMIIAFWSPFHPERMAVKRIIALEGDIVQTKEPYPLPTQKVPQGHVWVEGEHEGIAKTLDSNSYGPIAQSMIQGKVVGIIWPWSKAGRIRWQDWRGNGRVTKGTVENPIVLH